MTDSSSGESLSTSDQWTELPKKEGEWLTSEENKQETGKPTGRQPTPQRHFCRICHERNLMEPNISPCDCRGTMALVHKSCLERWLAVRDSSVCELCGYRFIVKKMPKYGVFKALLVWLTGKRTRVERTSLALDCLEMAVALVVLFLINYQTMSLLGTIQKSDRTLLDLISPVISNYYIPGAFKEMLTLSCLAVVTPITLDYLAILLQRLDAHARNWQRWYRSQWTLELVVPSLELEDPQ